MNVDWEAILLFLIGGVAGAAFSSVGQVVATRLTKDTHALEAKFVPYQGLFPSDAPHETARGVVLRNTGDFVERDIEARLMFLKHEPSQSYMLNVRLPVLVDVETQLKTEEHMREIQVANTYVIEYLSPGEEARFDFYTNTPLVEIHFSAATAETVTRIHWEHTNAEVMRQEAMEHVWGPPIPPPEDEEGVE